MTATVQPPARPQRRRRPPSAARKRAVGLCVLAVLALVVYAVFVRALPWAQPWTLRAVFANSAQITAGSPVRIAGLQVGEVSDVSRGPGTTAIVTMSIGSDGQPIHADATVTIRPRLFLEGSYYVDLHPGSPSTPAVSSGHTLPLPQTTIPVSFSTVLSTLTLPVRSGLVTIIAGFDHALSRGGAAGLHDGIAALAPTMRDGAVAAEALSGTGPDDVEQLIEGVDRVTQALGSESGALQSGLAAGAAVASSLAARDAQLAASLRATDATLAVTPAALRALTPALPALQRFSVALDPSLRVAPGVLDATDALLRQTRALVAPAELPTLVRQLAPISRQLTALAPQLDDLFPRVRTVSRCVSDQLVGLLDTELQDGKLTTGQPVWEELAHVNVGLASANQDFDAAGTRVRFATNIQPNLLALGSVPGAGVLLENSEQPILGIRPQWGGPTPPPVHPEVPCHTQPLGDLQAASVPMSTSSAVAR